MTEAQHKHELLLVWKHPLSRQRYLIGRLWLDGSSFVFQSETNQPRSLDEAVAHGFRLLGAFPSASDTYRSSELFATFYRRAFPAGLQESQGILSQLPPDIKAFEFLRQTGGRLSTDTLEFLEPIRVQLDQVEQYRFVFPIAGWRYCQGDKVLGELHEGTPLSLQPDTGNPYDPYAIKVLSPSGAHIGFVPSIYSWYLEEIVNADSYTAVVHEVNRGRDPDLRVRVDFRGSAPIRGYRSVPSGFNRYAEELLTK